MVEWLGRQTCNLEVLGSMKSRSVHYLELFLPVCFIVPEKPLSWTG